MAQISVWIHDSIHDGIKKFCKKEDISVSKWTKILIVGKWAESIRKPGEPIPGEEEDQP